MKTTFCFFALLFSSSALAQPVAPQLAISQPVHTGSLSKQQATQFLMATNVIGSGAAAQYTAGQAVTLLPGFFAQAGSVFSATMAQVISSRDPGTSPGLLVRAYPNPFVDQITIEYSSAMEGTVLHTLTDARGQVVHQSQELSRPTKGPHQLRVDGQLLPAGIYLYQVRVGSQVQTLRLIKKP